MPHLICCISFSETPEPSVGLGPLSESEDALKKQPRCSGCKGESAHVPRLVSSVIMAMPPAFSPQGKCRRHLLGGFVSYTGALSLLGVKDVKWGEIRGQGML